MYASLVVLVFTREARIKRDTLCHFVMPTIVGLVALIPTMPNAERAFLSVFPVCLFRIKDATMEHGRPLSLALDTVTLMSFRAWDTAKYRNINTRTTWLYIHVASHCFCRTRVSPIYLECILPLPRLRSTDCCLPSDHSSSFVSHLPQGKLRALIGFT